MKLVSSPEGLQLSAPNIGKRVVFTPNTQDDAKILQQAARQGYYYPLMALKHLAALSTGLTGKHNVFIPNINDFKTNSLQQVVVFVPGIAATVERRANDTLAITRLVLSDDYQSIERGSREKPGIYSVEGSRDLTISYRNNHRVTSVDHRQVVIADTGYETPSKAVDEVKRRLGAMLGEIAALTCDFDLFYTPLSCEMKGMRNYSPIEVNKTYAFAGLLADAMEYSANKQGIVWVSERRGSLVLTQALMALAAKQCSFQGQKHIVKMCWASSNPNPTFKAIAKLGMIADKGLLTSNSHIRTTLSATLGNARRALDHDDPYQWSDYSRELANGTMAANTIIGIGVLGAGAAINSPILATAGAITSGIGGLQFALQKTKERMDRGY